MANLRIEHLNKRYGATTVLNDINLGIENGEFVVLVGPSGCGKSTLLRMIAGLDGASGGDIHIAGKLVNNLAPRRARHCDGVPVLRALPAHERAQEHDVRPEVYRRRAG